MSLLSIEKRSYAKRAKVALFSFVARRRGRAANSFLFSALCRGGSEVGEDDKGGRRNTRGRQSIADLLKALPTEKVTNAARNEHRKNIFEVVLVKEKRWLFLGRRGKENRDPPTLFPVPGAPNQSRWPR